MMSSFNSNTPNFVLGANPSGFPIYISELVYNFNTPSVECFPYAFYPTYKNVAFAVTNMHDEPIQKIVFCGPDINQSVYMVSLVI